MESEPNYSVLSTNNSFFKFFKALKDKKAKNESISLEIEKLQAQLKSENPIICENAVNVLISSTEIGVEVGFILNSLVSSLPRLSAGCYVIIADGIIKLLLRDLEKSDYSCPFGIQVKAHPMLLLLDDSNENEKMLYLSSKIESVLNDFKGTIQSNAVVFLRPVLLMMLCSDKVYSESMSVWRSVLNNESMAQEIIAMRRLNSPGALLLFNSMVASHLAHSKDKIRSLILLIVSTKHLVASSLDPSKSLIVIKKHVETLAVEPNSSNVVLLLLAECLQIMSITHVPKLIEIFDCLITKEKFGHPIILRMILDGLIQVLAYPSFSIGKLGSIEPLINYITNQQPHQIVSTSDFNVAFLKMSPDVMNARDVCIMLETKPALDFKPFIIEAEKFFWTRNHLVLRGFFHSDELSIESWNVVLMNLISISKSDETLKSSLVMPLLFKLSSSTNPRMKLSILQNMIELGPTTEIFSIVKALSNGLLRSMSIDLHLRLWKIEPRTFPFLHKTLVEKSSKDSEDSNLEIVKASAIKEICNLRPQSAVDLVTIISEILNSSLEHTDAITAKSAAITIDCVKLLCQNHVVSATSTWKAISMTTRYEKRQNVIKSLCKFFSILPSLKRSSVEFELFMKEILGRLWHMIQWGNQHEIEYALNALRNWSYDSMTLDTIPEAYREGIALPEAPDGMEVSILDVEVPGECYVQLLTKVHPDGLQSLGELLIHYIGCEITEFRSGHYQAKEGQPEPSSYKNLPKQSILKALMHFLINQATTKKADKLVEERIVIETLRILGHRYSRPLPPLNWCFLHEMLYKSEEIKARCLLLAAKQSVISGTAKRLIENFLVNFLVNIDGSDGDDIRTALDGLVDLCNGVSPEVWKVFCNGTFKIQHDFEEGIRKCLMHEKDVTNRENLATMLLSFISFNSVPVDIIRLIPPSALDMISYQLSLDQKTKMRCEILKGNVKVEDPIGWITEIVSETLSHESNRKQFIESFTSLLMESDAFPKKKWLADFIILTQNRMVEMDFEAEKMNFLLDIFTISVIISSGYFTVLNSHEEIYNNRFQMLPQCIELVSRQNQYGDVVGKVFEFILHIVSSSQNVEIKTAFKNAIVISKDHDYFKKAKVWQKYLMMK